MKKHLTIFSLIVALVFAVNGVVQAQQHHDQQQSMKQPGAMQKEDMPMGNLPSMLEQMSENLRQENVTPEMMKQMSEQMKQMAQMMKQMSMGGSMMKQSPMQQQMPIMQQMPMMGNMMRHMPMMNMMPMMGNMMRHMPMMNMMPMMGNMMGMMPMMHQMMHGGHESEDHDPKSFGLKLQMQGEMMKAMGEIMMKYGTLMVEESASEE